MLKTAGLEFITIAHRHQIGGLTMILPLAKSQFQLFQQEDLVTCTSSSLLKSQNQLLQNITA